MTRKPPASKKPSGGKKPSRYLSITVVKDLFALCGNRCAFKNIDTGRACEEELTNPAWQKVKGEIAHIRGLEKRSARHDPTYLTPNDFWNLMVLCPNHHAHIDDLEPERYTVEVLVEMKAQHEKSAAPVDRWCTDERLEAIAEVARAAALQAIFLEALIPPDALEAEQMRHLLASTINEMPDRAKIVLTLHYYEGLTLAEIGQVLGVTTRTIQRYHKAAVTELQTALGPDGDAILDALDDVRPDAGPAATARDGAEPS